MDSRNISNFEDKYELNNHYNKISKKELNFEIANALETSNDLKSLIMIVAANKFREDSQKNKLYFFSFKPLEIDDTPKLLYYSSFFIWGIGYYQGKVSKLSGFMLFVGLKVFLNIRKNNYCKSVKEHNEYFHINKKLNSALKLKTKELTFLDYLYAIRLV